MNVTQIIPQFQLTDRLLDAIRKWAKLAPGECRIEAEWDGGFAIRVGVRLIHLHGEITQSEYDFLFCRVLDAIECRANLDVDLKLYDRGRRVWEVCFWTKPTWATSEKDEEKISETEQGDRLTATLSAYTQALEAMQNEPN